jgi:crotonobetainyl-CoA:carnitine CoA-transferase CaiB-like acyl-CoA transferase
VSGPLEGVRILDLTRLLPGNYCTLLLADLGADVVKVEEPERGDYIRLTPPLVDGEGAAHRALNRGKRSVTVNLKSAEGVGLLRRMVKQADALVESFRPGVLDRLGVGYRALSQENPRLVFCALTGYGQDGPYRDRAGHDINYIGYAGILQATGRPEGPPILPSVQVGDFGGGMAAAIGVLACLGEAARTGRGRMVDVSMLDVSVSWTSVLMSWYLATGERPGRGLMPLGGGLACYRVYRAGDGRYLAVGALEPQFWRALCERLDVPELIDEQFASPRRQEEVAASLGQVFASRPRDEWVRDLADLDTCVGPIQDVAEAVADPQVRGRRMVGEVGDRQVGPGPAIKVSGFEPERLHGAPVLGEHTEEVLGELGLTREEIDDLRTARAI